VIEYKEKNYVYYSLNMTVFDELLMWFKGFMDAKEGETGKTKAKA